MAKVYSGSLPIGRGADGMSQPVLYDPHYAIRINRPPVTLITGSPGSGKTMAAMLFAAHSALFNKITFVLDPKGDFIALDMLRRQGHLENVHIWQVFDDDDKVNEQNVGMLDPTCLTNNTSVNASLTLETVNALVKHVSMKQRNALIPIIRDVAESENPSFRSVTMILARSRDPEVATLSHELNLALSMPAGRLLTASSRHTNKLKLDKGLIIASLMGLSLPASSKSEDSYLEKERLSVAIVRLLTHLVLDIMKKVPKSVNKTLLIDEAWAVFNNQAGRDLIDEVALLGRSLNMAVILATQSPSHIQGKEGESSLDNTISTRFAFRNTSNSDNLMTVDAMGLPKGVNYEGTFKNFEIGQCLMKDSQDQFSFINIMLPYGWIDVIETTPSPES